MILCYHSVESGWTSPLAVPPADFEAQCAWLARTRHVVDLPEALARADRRGRLPRGMVAITFDDGLSDLHSHALPVLQRYRLPATVFLVAQTLTPEGKEVDWVDTPPDWALATLTLDQILEMQEGGVRFASHTWAHRDMPSLGEEEAVRDLRDSRELLEDKLGRPMPYVAYPRGRHAEHVRRAAERAGYTHALSLPVGPEFAGRFAVPRVGIFQGNSLPVVRVKSSRWYLPLRTGTAYAAAMQIRKRL